jgi:alcohol dehydrogenase (cytochrome c)
MTRKRTALGIGFAGAVAGVMVGALPISAAEVTYQRLVNAKNEPQNWLLRHGTYDAQYSSPLTQINRSNAANLRMVFMASLMSDSLPPGRQLFTPLVEDGFMYVGNGWHQYTKFDVREASPKIVWTWDAKDDSAASQANGVVGQGMVGAALYGNNMYVNTSYPPRLIAVNVNSGEPVFDVSALLPDVLKDQRFTAPPLPIKDKVLIGNSAGDPGNRGYVAAYNANTGQRVWRFITVPGPGEPGHDTWPAHAWETGGGAIWSLGTYDADLNLAYFGTGNPVPFTDPQWRPGDNLYTNSIIALNADSGALSWYFQETPNESWDYDAVSPKVLYDINEGGARRKVVGTISRDGFAYTWDRQSGQFMFAQPWTTVNWTKGLDPKTGKPLEYNPRVALQDYGTASIRYGQKDTTARNLCPHFSGGPTVMNPHYDEKRGRIYFFTTVACYNIWNTVAGDPATKRLGNGAWQRVGLGYGLLASIDIQTGKIVQEERLKYAPYAGVLGTDGDILFTANAAGRISVYDKDTLKELWGFETGNKAYGNPMTYSVNGKQYFAMTIGGANVDRSAGYPEVAKIPRNALLVVFGL